jgi:cyclase
LTLKSRLIPILLLRDGLLVKTVQFEGNKYVGDPINAIRIFNEKEADELIVVDIGATVSGAGPDLNLIRVFAAEYRMPLGYVGGIKNLTQIERLINSGLEKVGISSAAINNSELISAAADQIGSQSVMAVIDVKRSGDAFEICTHNGTQLNGSNLKHVLDSVQSAGAGEIVVNSIDRDGTMSGYDHELVTEIMSQVNVPVTVIGGAANLADCIELDAKFGPLGIGVGSAFVFKGKFKAVLITYPDRIEREAMFARFDG